MKRFATLEESFVDFRIGILYNGYINKEKGPVCFSDRPFCVYIFLMER